MGLAGPKRRTKLSHDPNNTKWTRDTQSFGHKIMASQGWVPGDHLGVKDSAHSEFHTEANFSHIRVTIKDDNLGLGAKIGSGVGPGQCTGLDAFQNLLGRLNGKDEEEIEKEQKSKDDLRRAIYSEQRWGSIRFVKGGLLIGDKIQDLIDNEKERVRKLKGEESSSGSESSEEDSGEEEEAPIAEKKKSKKRKLEDVEEVVPEVVAIKTKKSKKHKISGDADAKARNSETTKIESSSASDAEVTETLSKVELSKKARKAKKEALADAEADSETSEDEEARRLRKQEKRKRKEEKRLKKAQAKAAAETESSKESRSKSKKDKKKRDKDKSSSKESSRVATIENTPTGSGTSTPVLGGRHAVRARNIAQKRLAAMDVAGLNQIFMIKS